MPVVIQKTHVVRTSGDTHYTCCSMMHVITATWVIAVVHLIIVGYIWLMGMLYFLGVTDTREYTRFDGAVSFAGTFGQGGLMIGATIW
jgi:hypothetical protein